MPPIDYSNLDTEITCLAQLGNFAIFPAEVRLLLWEAFFNKIRFSPVKYGSNILSILCCSRYLYREISYLIYEDMVHDIHVYTPSTAKIVILVSISSKRLQYMDEWELPGTKDLRRHIQNFPHHRIQNYRLGLDISHHYQADPGQMINLWRTINKFVDFIKDSNETSPRTPGPYVCVQLVGKWHDGGSPRQSIRDMKSNFPYRYDHDIAILPFLGLPNTKWECTFPTDLWTIIAEKQKSLSYQGFHELSNVQQNTSGGFDAAPKKWTHDNPNEVQRWLTDTRIFLDTALDTLQGSSAKILRRERFQNWYEDGRTWKSAYEEQFEHDLSNNRDIMLKYDPNLHKARWRHEMLIIWHHIIHAPEDDPERINAFHINTKRTLYTTWNSSAWSQKEPRGIDRLPQGEPCPIFNRYYFYRDYERRSGMKASSFSLFGVENREDCVESSRWDYHITRCLSLNY